MLMQVTTKSRTGRQYVLCLFDWRIIENEATNENYEDSHVYVSFDQTPPNKSYFIFIGK